MSGKAAASTEKADPRQLQGQWRAEAICLEKPVSTCWRDFLQPAKRHEETAEWSVLQDNRPSLFHVSVMTKRSGDYSRAGDVIYI